MEEMTDVEVQGAETQPEITTATESTNGGFSVPEEYKNEGWTRNLTSIEDLWKMNANAQAMIGKKTLGIPNAESTDTEWDEFYGKIRPAKADDYKIDKIDGDANEYKKLFHDNGLSQRQVDGIVKGYNAMMDKIAEPLFSKDGYNAELNKRFGDKAESIAKSVNSFIERNASDEDKVALNKMPNNVLGVVMSLINSVQTKYAVNDTDTGATNTSASSAEPDWSGYAKAATELARHPHTTADLNELRVKFNIPTK
jgi:hypothetical protein